MPRIATSENPASVCVTIAIPQLLKDAAKSAAEGRGETISTYARRAIAKAVLDDAKAEEVSREARA